MQLTLPSAFLGQVVSGPCPSCGWILVFCHGRIESAPRAEDGLAIEMPEAAKPWAGPRRKLPRTGTLDVAYLDDTRLTEPDEEVAWGEGHAEATRGGPGTAAPGAGAQSRRGAWIWMGLGAIMLAAGGFIWHWSRPGPAAPAPQLVAPGTGGGGVREWVPGWGDAAVAAWQAFARAGTAEDKLAHVLDARRVEPVLRAFYASAPEAEAAWLARELRPLPGTPDDRRRGIVALGSASSGPGDRPLIVFLRLAPATVDASSEAGDAAAPPRFLLDWETYIQESQRLAERFVEDPALGRRTLRLAIERVHVFADGESKPDTPEPLGLKLRTPSGLLLAATAEVRPGTPLHDRLSAQLRWGLTAYATLKLAWETGTTPPPRLVATDLVCWHFPGLGNAPEFTTELSPLPELVAP
ncbi:MAG: hypothetical protein ACKV19_22065 [Verrucomicrobiales bacterium]